MSEQRRHEEAGEAVTRRAGGDAPNDERGDGRPKAGEPPPADEVPTIAPEERGETPETEHAPGADL